MNRYTLAGILADMRAGKTVLFLAADMGAVRDLLADAAVEALPGERVARARGHESIHAVGDGSIRFRSIRSDLRGHVADVVVFDVDPYSHYELIDQIWRDFRGHAARPVEFIRP